MPVFKTYLLPHSPLLIPEIGKANTSFLEKTILAYQKIKEDLKNANIETVIVISSHNNPQENSFFMNCAPEMDIEFQDFGFIPAETKIKGDIPLFDYLKNNLKEDWDIKSLSESSLDYGSAIPLYLLQDSENVFKTITIAPAENIELEKQIEFGKSLGEILKSNKKRIAIIASGDLSHRLNRKSPAGYSPKGPKFNNKLIERLNNPDTAIENLVKFDEKLILEANECALKSILITLGAIDDRKWKSKSLAYQTDFGIGYLSMEFILEEDSVTNIKLDKQDGE